MTDKVHCIVVVDNVDRNQALSNSATDFVYQIATPITFLHKGKDKQYFVRAENINLPISFYGINQYNNYLTFQDDSGIYTITVPQGNYTIDELITDITSRMNAVSPPSITYDLSYDEITQKVNLATGGTANFTWYNPLVKLLGYLGNEVLDVNDNYRANGVAYTNTTRYLKLVVDNLTSNNMYDSKSVQKLTYKIPINKIRNDFQFFDNNSGYKIKLQPFSSINQINVRLLDPDNHVVDLNGVPFSFDLVFYEYNMGNLPTAQTDFNNRMINYGDRALL